MEKITVLTLGYTEYYAGDINDVAAAVAAMMKLKKVNTASSDAVFFDDKYQRIDVRDMELIEAPKGDE